MNGEHTAYRGTVRRKDERRVPAPVPSGYKWVNEGETEIVFIATLDLNLLKQMALKASRNKRGRSVDGPLQVEVTRMTKVL